MGLEDFPQLVCCEECQRASFGARRRRATHYRVSCKMVPAEEARSKGYRAPYPSLSAFAFEKEIRTPTRDQRTVLVRPSLADDDDDALIRVNLGVKHKRLNSATH